MLVFKQLLICFKVQCQRRKIKVKYLENIEENDNGQQNEDRSGDGEENSRSGHRETEDQSGKEEEHQEQVGHGEPSKSWKEEWVSEHLGSS